MAYTKQTWNDGSGGGTPISGARLTHIEDGVDAAHDELAGHVADSTNVHGIADTAALVTTADSRLSDARTPTDNSVSTAKIQDNAVTLAKLLDIETARLLGRVTAGSGDAELLTAAQVRTMLDLVVGTNVQAWDADLDTLAANNAGTTTWLRALLDSAYVALTGAQSVGGVKTFTDAPVVPDGSFAIADTTGLQAALDAKEGHVGIAAGLLTGGESTVPRALVDNSSSSGLRLDSGVLRLTYFTAKKTENITQLRVITGNPAAGATPTLVRFGVYSVAANGDLTLVASIANDTTLLSTTFSRFTRSLSATWAKTQGQRYAFGGLCVTAAAAPILAGAITSAFNAGEAAEEPRLTGTVTGQTDLPASILAASVGTTTNAFGLVYGALLP